MTPKIYIIDQDTNEEIPADVFIKRDRTECVKARWLVVRCKGIKPFKISKNNLYEKCQTADFTDRTISANRSQSRLGTETEWRILHDAKDKCGLDTIISALEGDVIGCKFCYTQDGAIVRHYSGQYTEVFERSQIQGRAAEIFGRCSKNVE